MSISAEQTQSWLDQHAETSFSGQNLDWLNEQRQQALRHFEKVGLPGVRDEQWRYTNLRALKSNLFCLPKASSAGAELPELLTSPKHARLVFVDGHFSETHSSIETLPSNIIFTSLKSLLAQSPDLIAKHFGSTIPTDQHGFTALNSAYCQDGYVLILSKDSSLDKPVEVLFFSSEVDTQVSHCRNLVIAAANTKCTVIERHLGNDGSIYLNNNVTEIIAGENSHIDHYKLHQESNDAFHIGGIFINQGASTQVKTHNIALSGLVTRNDISTDLTGAGGHVEMNGLVMGAGRQHVDNHTQVNHLVPNCTSDEYYKTILDDQSRSVFRGRIVVTQDAQLTNADQQNNNLLLSSDAEADTLPQLEIYADDVKCSHGATVGQLDEKSLFYLRSRGISLESAIALLTVGFANEVINRIQVDSIREEITTLITGQLLNAGEAQDE